MDNELNENEKRKQTVHSNDNGYEREMGCLFCCVRLFVVYALFTKMMLYVFIPSVCVRRARLRKWLLMMMMTQRT